MATDDPQVEAVVGLLRRVLGTELAGAYLFGSAVLGGLRPHSDLDVMAVSNRPTSAAEKRALVAGLLPLSGRPRYLEVTVVVSGDVRPWRYPPRMDFQYGDWWRPEFERGEIAPWGADTNPDLASLIRMVLLADAPLVGPPAHDAFDPVPRADYVASLVHGVGGLLGDVDSDTRNVVLTLARVWHGLVTDEVVPKDGAADWVLPRLPEEHRRVLAEARDIYRGERDDWSADPVAGARSYAEHVAGLIRAAAPGGGPSPV